MMNALNTRLSEGQAMDPWADSGITEALLDALGIVVAEMRADWEKDLAEIKKKADEAINYASASGLATLINGLQKRVSALEQNEVAHGGRYAEAKFAESLDARLKAVERAGIRFRGVWQRANDDYKRGDLTTHDGALWCAYASPTGAPGVDASWVLAAKSSLRDKAVMLVSPGLALSNRES